jgi:hypothetical protein
MASRRVFLALAGTGVAAFLPHSWTKPVIETVIVPAHAQASPGTTPVVTTTTTTAAPTTTPAP